MAKNKIKHIKSPLNYIGGKHKLLPQILPLFPSEIDTFIDLFTGGCNIGINVCSKRVICNDNLIYLIELYHKMKNSTIEEIILHVQLAVEQYDLSLTNEDGYKRFRSNYNDTQEPMDLFVLIAYSFNHQIRFNSNHKYNNPFGKNRSSFNNRMKTNLINFVDKLHSREIDFTSYDFEEYNFSNLSANDFVYCDPPYLIAAGSYNDGKRGFKGWGNKEEYKLLEILDSINEKGIKFALSNVLEHKGKRNDILYDWLENNDYNLHILSMNYSNSSYNKSVKTSSIEVLITNYNSE